MLNKLWLFSTALAFIGGFACTGEPKPEKVGKNDSSILKVAVLASGRITVDGSVATVESLRESFKKLAERGGTVWYYREQGQAEPPPQAMAVMQAIVDNQLPVRLSTKPDYSDVIGEPARPIR